MRRGAIALAVLAAAGSAAAEPAPDLRVRGLPLPLPEHLGMRVALLAAAKEPAARKPAAEKPAARPAADESPEQVLDLDARLRQRIRASDALGQRRSLDEKVVLNLSLGVGVDGGQPSDEGQLLSGSQLDETSDYARLRSYGFGDLVVGTNGLGLRSLRTYFATSYRFDTPLDRNTGPVPSVFDGELADYVVHAAWVDVEDVFDNPVLKPLYVRAGRQFKYGVAVTHFSGITVGYKSKAFRAAVFGGTRSSPYGFDAAAGEPGQGGVVGFESTLDLFDYNRFPLVLSASDLRFSDNNHLALSAALRWSRNVLVRARLRTLDGSAARETLKVRTRISPVTTAALELDNQTSRDWVYDLLLIEKPENPDDPRTYLNLGAPRPRLRLAGRAGTVLLRNIDLLFHGALAVEYANDEKHPPSAFRSSYGEIGSALEVRYRRNLRLGASATGRLYRRPRATRQVTADQPDELPADTKSTGERSFVELGLSARYSLGARKFGAGAELYGRILRPRSEYVREEDEERDVRAGGRFSIDGWASERIRLGLVYDLSLSQLRYAPELEGIKSLRITAEGQF